MAEILSHLETRGYGESAEEALRGGFDSADEEACGAADDGALDERPAAVSHHVGGTEVAKVAKRVRRPLTIAERSEKRLGYLGETASRPDSLRVLRRTRC